jgi:GNAT superfamily N-acetyltransferase
MPIVPCPDELMDQAEALVRSVFGSKSPFERLSFVVLRNPRSIAARIVMILAGIRDIVAFDVYVDDGGKVIGTTGLYRYRSDAHEAVWLAWFCVDPKHRRRGIGQAMLDHTVSLARRKGFCRIRLYTSTAPEEAAAQRLYERNGFRETGRKKGMSGTTIFRETILCDGEGQSAARDS